MLFFFRCVHFCNVIEMKKMGIQREICANIYKQIISYDENFMRKHKIGDIFIRDLEKTQSCDKFLDLSEERSFLKDYLNKRDNTLHERILNEQPLNSVDKNRATKTFNRFYTLFRSYCLIPMPFSFRFYYGVCDTVEGWKKQIKKLAHR